MSNNLTVTADLINDKVKFSGLSRDNHEVIIDYVHPIGNGEGYTPLELFLISLATCSGMTLTLLLRKMHKDVSELKVIASGERRATYPTYFKSIQLSFELASKDVQPHDIEKALKLSEESLCPIWNMVKNNVDISSEYNIIYR
ncbi:OsmC family protein [Clostridium aciditolerans]|uniref:OsmC family protein n=1 Tax=Clostridium aciditolerans TaxID=339861 RepID=A0A934M3P7_9CLOT|nr:OsmC family protein [Clostridium aciditolerans]MBI6871813.1 OsmC family protein [Clostridium aciditolerans]